ncbi:MAG: protease complex subunit PrcB family protein [Candidatus Binatia bacterium]
MLSFLKNQALRKALSSARGNYRAVLIFVLGLVGTLAHLNCGSPALTQTSVPVSTLQKGNFSGVREALQIVIRTQGEWDDLWKRHSSNQAGPTPTPSINFATEMVVGLFVGEKSTGGYEVEITRAERRNSRLYLYYLEKSPPRDAMVIQVLTQPYHLVKIPRDSSPVTFLRASP